MGEWTKIYGSIEMDLETFKGLEGDLKKVFVNMTFDEESRQYEPKEGFNYNENAQELEVYSYCKHYGDDFDEMIEKLSGVSSGDHDHLLEEQIEVVPVL